MPKYEEYFEKMLEDNKEIFQEFRKIHDSFQANPNKANQEKLNRIGVQVLEIIREYENRLCANTERGIYSKFSANLAEKFQNLIRKNFPKIDYIGLRVEGETTQASFFIKKINLD